MLELGRAGSCGVGQGVLPVLRDGAVVATLRASGWKEQAVAVIGEREWLFGRRRGELTARWAVDPEGAVRFRAGKSSWWRGTWAVDLEGRAVEVEKVSVWKGAHRYSSAGTEIGRSGSTGGWRPRLTLHITGDLGLDQQVFLLWLEVVVGRRNDTAAGAGVGAAVIAGSG